MRSPWLGDPITYLVLVRDREGGFQDSSLSFKAPKRKLGPKAARRQMT
jgi:hypothetical protein